MPLVRLSNGTVVDTDQLNWSPSAGGGTMYDATRITPPFSPPPVPAPLQGTTKRTVQTVAYGADGKPRAGSAFGGGWGSNGFILPGMNQPTQTAMLPYPDDSRTSAPPVGPSQFTLMNQRDRIEDRPAPQVARAPTTIDAANPLDMSFYGLTPSAPSNNSALQAIDQLTGSGRNTAMPFPLMAFNQPRVPNVPLPRTRPDPSGLVGTGETLPGASNFDGTPVEIMVRGGNRPGSAFGGGWGSTGFALPSMNKPPSVPAPRNTGSYVIQKGDNLETLAKRFGTTVKQLQNANGIKNANRIYAGQSLNLGYLAPPVPRKPPAALGRGYAQPSQNRPRETFDQIWAEARG